MRVLVLILLFYLTAQAQSILIFDDDAFYTYEALTDTAINITHSAALIKGENDITKSDKTDTLATKRAVQNWMVLVGVDSVQGLTRQLTGLTEDTEYSYYHSAFVYTASGDKSIDYYQGVTKTFTTDAAPAMPDGLYLVINDNEYLVINDDEYLILNP